MTSITLSLVFLPMIKTNTKKKSSPKKTPAIAAKAPVAKKVSPSKKTVAKSAPKKPVRKATPQVAHKNEKSLPHSSTNDSKEGVKMLGILHLVGNIFSGGLLGIILVVIYLLIQKDQLSQLEKETCYEIINFNLSFIIYTFISACAMFILVGFLLLPIVVVTGIVLMIMGFLRHLVGENYRYPLIIRFIS